MKIVVMEKGKTEPKEYLKNMLDCIDEDGELCIAREIDDIAFCTAESEEDASYVEKVQLDVSLVDYDSLYAFYEKALRDIGVFIAEYAAAAECSVFASRMVTFAKRINKLIKLKAPEAVLQIEKCMFIDSILLFKARLQPIFLEIISYILCIYSISVRAYKSNYRKNSTKYLRKL